MTSAPAPRVRKPRGPARFKQKDVERALKAAMRLNYPAGVRIAPDGSITVIPVTPEPVQLSNPNPWDEP